MLIKALGLGAGAASSARVASLAAGGAVALVLAWGTSVGVVWHHAYQAGADSVVAQQTIEDKAAARAADAAASAAARAVSKVRVQGQTIIQEVRHEIDHQTVYRDCEHSPGQLQRINAALGHGALASAPGGGQLPAARSTDRPQLWGDDGGPGAAGDPVPPVPRRDGVGPQAAVAGAPMDTAASNPR